MAKEVTKVQSGGAVAAYDYGDMAGMGFEDRGRDAISLPYLNILQALSPQVSEETVAGAKAGMFFNNVTNDLDDKVKFLWCHAETKYVEWIPREKGGGFVAVHEPTSDVVAKAKQQGGSRATKLHVGDNDLIETRYVYGLALDDDLEIKSFVVLANKSKNLKVVRNWFTSMLINGGKDVPTFAFVAELFTTREKNEKGSWHQLAAKPALGKTWKDSKINPATHGHLLLEAKNLITMVKSGAAKVDYAADSKPSEAGEAGGEGEAVPF